jgi:hypothetical protein
MKAIEAAASPSRMGSPCDAHPPSSVEALRAVAQLRAKRCSVARAALPLRGRCLWRSVCLLASPANFDEDAPTRAQKYVAQAIS